MFYKQLLKHSETLSNFIQDDIDMLDAYLASLNFEESRFIYASVVSNILNIDKEKIKEFFILCSEIEVLSPIYEVFCPEDEDVCYYYTKDQDNLKNNQFCDHCSIEHSPLRECEIYLSFELQQILASAIAQEFLKKKSPLTSKPLIATIKTFLFQIIMNKEKNLTLHQQT